jgi:hypothetical protein
MFEQLSRSLHQYIDPMPERAFHLLSGLVLITVAMRFKSLVD